MDSGGFLIMHEDFLLASATSSDVQYVHITEKEKNIAEDLIKKKYLVKKHCRHLEEIQKQSFYELSLPLGGADTLQSGARCSKYQLQKIVGTNAFLGMNSYLFMWIDTVIRIEDTYFTTKCYVVRGSGGIT